MRILHIDKFVDAPGRSAGGAGGHVRTLRRLQRARGHDVHCFGCAVEGGPPEMPRFHDFAADKNPLSLARMIHNTEAAWKLQKYLDRTRIDVAHVHNIYHHLSPSILSLLGRRRIAIVMTLHDYRLACPTKHLYRPDGLCARCVPNMFFRAASFRCAGLAGAALAVESYFQRLGRRYYRWVDFFLCPTEYMRSVMLRTGVPAGKAVVLRHAIEAAGGKSWGGPAGQGVLFAGRLSKEKGPALMLDLARRLSDVPVVIAGDGPLADELSRSVRRLGLGNVRSTGWVDRESLEVLYREAAIVVLTSVCMENSPLTVLEAMAAGRCVVVPDQPALAEWVADGETGRTYATGNAEQLSRVVRQVLSDPAGCAKMGRAGRALVAARHDPDRLIDQLDGWYTEAIRRCALRW